MSQFTSYALALLLGISTFANAQTWTNCNPLNRTCPGDTALGIANATFDLTEGIDTSVWNITAGTITTGSDGAEYVIKKRLDSPTMQSQFYFMFGVVEVHMKAATGQGIISSIVLESDDLDEIDWELMGGNTTHVETNYFGKGNQTVYDRAVYYPVTVGGGPMDTYHNYTLVWTSEKLEWWVDSSLVRTLAYADANGGNNYPQTPMTLRLGIWAGGDSGNSKGTIEWAGGETDYSKVPFTMLVKNATVTDYGTGSLYTYSDKSGSWQSIKEETTGLSTIAKEIKNASSSKAKSPSAGSTSSDSAASSATAASATASKWDAMSSTAHIAVYAGGAAGVVALAGLAGLCCLRQRKNGIKARAAEDAMLEAQRRDNVAYAGMGLKEQDSLPFDTPTPAKFASRGNSMRDESYYGAGEVSATPPPVYQNSVGISGNASRNQTGSPGFGGTDRLPGSASPPVSNGNGFNFNSGASSRGPASPVSPINSYGQGGGFAGHSDSNVPSAAPGFLKGGYSRLGNPHLDDSY